MLQSFFVYTIFGLSLYILGSISAQRQTVNNRLKQQTPFWIWDVALALLIFAIVSGLRWNVGVDHLAYLNNYLMLQNAGYTLLDKEYLFELVTRIFAKADIHFVFYFGFLAFLQIFFIYRAFKDERYLYPFLGIIIIFGTEYLGWMNGIRQMLVATVFVWAIQFIQKRQLLIYIIVIALASLMHKSALILLIFYFIPQRDYFKHRMVMYILVVITLYFGNNNSWISILNNLGGFLELLGYEKIGENMDSFMENEKALIIGPRRLVMILTTLALIWFAPLLKIRFKDTYFLTYFNLTIAGFLYYNLFSNANLLFIRPVMYLSGFSILTSAYLFVYLRENISRRLLALVFVMLLTLAYLPMSIVADSGKGKQDFTNYKFYWDYVN